MCGGRSRLRKKEEERAAGRERKIDMMTVSTPSFAWAAAQFQLETAQTD